MNEDHHAPFDHVSNSITHCTDLVHMVEMLKIASGRQWKSQTITWMRKGDEIGQYISTTLVAIYMRLLPAESTVMFLANVIYYSDDVSCGVSEIQRYHSFCIQMFVHRKDSLAVNKDCMQLNIQLLSMQ